MAYTNNNGQVRVGVRSGITNSPLQQTNTISASLLQSLYGVWNGDTTTNELGTSLYGVWNAEYSGTASLSTSLYGVWNGESTTNTLDTSLYALYKAEGNANDSVGTNHGTLLNGATFSTGKIGTKSFYFDGVNDYISLPNNSLNFTGDFSISVWVDVSSISTWQHVFNPVNNISGNYGWRLVINGNSYAFNIGNGTAITQLYFEATYDSIAQISPLVGTAMKNVVITRKAGVGTKMYINGVLKASNNSIVNPSYLATMTPKFGDGNTINKLDNIGFWNKELSDLEAIQLYNNNVGIDYPFNGNLLQSTNDVFGSNHGTLMNGTTFTTGKIGNAFSFDGVNDYVRLPNNSLDLTGDFSISMWANWGRNNTSQILMSNFTIGASTRGWFIEHAAGQLRFRGFNSSGGNAFYIAVSNTPPLNTWIHYTFVHKNNSNMMYANGVLIGSDTTGSTHVAYDSPNYPLIGANQYNSTTYQEFFLGKLDAVSVWNRELTSNEVSMLYNGSNGTQYSSGSFGLTQSSLDSFGTNHGALVNTTYGTGISGNSFQFNGTSAYVSFPTNSWNSLVGSDLTISLWVKFTSTANQTLISNMTSPSINVWSGWEIRLDGGRPTIFMWNNAGDPVGAQGGVISTNTWYHIVATRKKGSRTRIYINGSLAQTDSINTNDPWINGTYYPNIGHLQYTSSSHFLYMTNGSLIDSVNLWSKEISADEVTQLYNSGTGAQYPFTGTFSSAGNQLGVDNGTLMNGCYLSDGKIGKAFTFDGVNDYIDLPNNSMNFTGDFSVSGWINQSSIKSYHMIIGNQGTSTGNWHGWLVWVFNNKLTFDLYNGNSAVASGRWQTTTTLSTNTWIHFTITKKPGQAVKIYLDGVIGGGLLSGSNSANVTYTTTNYATIGLNKYSNPIVSSDAGYWHGKIDSLNVYQKELTQAEVTELYNSGNGKQIATTPIVQTGLVLNLDASRSSSYHTGTTWTDISGNGNNGTFTNGPVFGTASGGVITFDGVNDYVSVADSTSLRFGTGAYTINLWVKPTSFSGSKVLIQKGSLLGGWQLYFDSVGYLHFTQQFVVDISTILFSPNQWKNIVFTSNGGTDRNIYMYVNGVSTGTYTCTGNQNYNLTSALTIGADGVGNNYFLNGNITNVLLYNRALSTTEVLQNFNATKSRFGL